LVLRVEPQPQRFGRLELRLGKGPSTDWSTLLSRIASREIPAVDRYGPTLPIRSPRRSPFSRSVVRMFTGASSTKSARMQISP